MKQATLSAICLLISISCLGIKKYTIPKDDFLKQLSTGSIRPSRVYCYQEDGSKVWLFYNRNSILTIELTNGGKKEVILPTVKLKDGVLAAIVYDVWGFSNKKVYTVNVDQIQSFYIERKTMESVMKFVNIDSTRALARLKNDSLANVFTNRHDARMIRWIPKGGSKKDTIYIKEDACYHLEFKDKRQTEYGIVQKITQDSIYITSVYNEEWAAINKTVYQVLGYATQDIAQIRLARSGGFGYKTIKAEDYDVITSQADNTHLRFPCWYAAGPTTAELEFYRAFLAEDGYPGIKEEKGRMYWYEGQ